ncbi:hypothetical protein, partial [Pseudomonas mandelii]|uniref:hypothetical protein n=1 Tax=Pseudomonas mandelii TaxID=75612 RepID=UPI003D00DCD0
MSTDKTNQSWGGRFSEPVDAFVARFTASVTFECSQMRRRAFMDGISCSGWQAGAAKAATP